MSGSSSRSSRFWQFLLATLSVALAGAIAPPGYAASGPGCLIVSVADSIELPDGSIYPAGDLSLCLGRPLSPVTALHRVSVGGLPVGMLLSRRGTSEGPATAEPSVLFRRVASDRLRLVGYAWPAASGNLTYLLRDPSETARRFRDRPGDVEQAARRTADSAILLAARRE